MIAAPRRLLGAYHMAATSSSMEASAVPTDTWPAASTAERCVAFSRGVVLSTALLMVEGETLVGERDFGALDFLVCVALVYGVGTSVLMVLGRENMRLQFPLLVADMILITGIIYMYGGVTNEYYLLYYLPILQASIRLNFRDAIASALLSSGLYGLVGLSSGPDTLVPTTAQLRAGTFAASAVFMAAFFALLSREARAHIRRSEQMARLAGALSEKNRELEEKTRELAAAQESLVASERLAAIGGLAGSVGHELRNPLGVIRNAAYYLRSQLQEPEADVDEMLELMDREVETCDRTIAALLDFARPEEATPERIDVNELVSELVNNIEPPEGISIDLRLDDDLPPARADRHHLERVFKNILSNAFQAMTNGGNLTVTTGLSKADDTVCVEWSDTGPGIAERDLHRIFDPLFTTKAKGIGLGLVVCKRLVERQGGRLEVRSEVGKGASFIVHLRRSEVATHG